MVKIKSGLKRSEKATIVVGEKKKQVLYAWFCTLVHYCVTAFYNVFCKLTHCFLSVSFSVFSPIDTVFRKNKNKHLSFKLINLNDKT